MFWTWVGLDPIRDVVDTTGRTRRQRVSEQVEDAGMTLEQKVDFLMLWVLDYERNRAAREAAEASAFRDAMYGGVEIGYDRKSTSID